MAKKEKTTEPVVEILAETNDEIDKRLERYKASLIKQAKKNEGKLKDRMGPCPKDVEDEDMAEYRSLRAELQQAKFLRSQLLTKMDECKEKMEGLRG
jgi:hypothetical protein